MFNQSIYCRFISNLNSIYRIPSNPIVLPLSLNSYELSQIVNSFLPRENRQTFDFMVNGKILSTNLDKFITEQNITSDKLLNIEYFIRPTCIMKKKIHDDWVSNVIGSPRKQNIVLTGSYMEI